MPFIKSCATLKEQYATPAKIPMYKSATFAYRIVQSPFSILGPSLTIVRFLSIGFWKPIDKSGALCKHTHITRSKHKSKCLEANNRSIVTGSSYCVLTCWPEVWRQRRLETQGYSWLLFEVSFQDRIVRSTVRWTRSIYIVFLLRFRFSWVYLITVMLINI